MNYGNEETPDGGVQTIPAPTTYESGSNGDLIRGMYQDDLGRAASDAEIQSHLGNPGGIDAVRNLIQNSSEGRAYAAKQAADSNDNAKENLFDSPLLQPWTVPFSQPAFSYQDFKPSVTFKPTTAADLYADPGYQARLDAQQKAMERGAAAKGTLLNGGTVQDEMKAGQDYASNEFGNVDARNHANFNTIYGADQNTWSTNYQHSLTDWTANYNKSLQEYQQAYNIFSNNQANQFNRLASVTGMGQTAAGQLGSTGLNYANLYGNTNANTTGAVNDANAGGANARAAGTVGAANAWNNAFGNIGNNTMANLYKSSYATNLQ